MLAGRGTVQVLGALQALSRVPGTCLELPEVAQALGADPPTILYLDAQATVPQVGAFNAAGRLGQPHVLAFATHSLIGGEITGLTQPALVLTPPATPSPEDHGLLSLDEILMLKLSQTRLVVLSGRNTAAADRSGEGLSGLTRAFFFAGAPAVLVSHWSVEDRATQALMAEVFRRYASDPTLAWAEAVRQGTVALLLQAWEKTAYFAHPFAWTAVFPGGLRWVGPAGGRRAYANQWRPGRWVSLSEKQFLQGARPARGLGRVNGSQRCIRSAAAPLTCRQAACREQPTDGQAMRDDGLKATTTIYRLLPPLTASASSTATISSDIRDYTTCLS